MAGELPNLLCGTKAPGTTRGFLMAVLSHSSPTLTNVFPYFGGGMGINPAEVEQG